MRLFMSSLPLSAALFAFWILLSGKLDVPHLGAGALTALLIGRAAGRLWTLPPTMAAGAAHPFRQVQWMRAALYGPWLVREVIVSAFQVAYVVLHPRLPIAPRMLRVRSQLPHTLGLLTLANSITLTPGTVTVDVEGDELLVHALTPESARGVELGVIHDRIAAIFDAAPGASGDRP